MKCPNCDKEMKYKDKGYWGYPFSTGIEPDYPDWFPQDVYTCKECKIKKVNDEWTIPKKYLPTEKQVKTILYINNHLRMDLETLTKHQCWLDIGKYFDKAKKTPLHSSEYYEDLQEYFGFCEGDFC